MQIIFMHIIPLLHLGSNYILGALALHEKHVYQTIITITRDEDYANDSVMQEFFLSLYSIRAVWKEDGRRCALRINVLTS